MDEIITVGELDFRGRGVGRLASGQTVFVNGALPAERVRLRLTQSRAKFAEAQAVEILEKNPARIVPRCAHYEQCGGCDLQHATVAFQREAKARLWQTQLQRLGGFVPKTILPAVLGAPWGYRARARLSVSPAGVLGFKARSSATVVPIRECPVLAPPLAALLPELAALLPRFPARTWAHVTLHLAADETVAVGFWGRGTLSSLAKVGRIAGATLWANGKAQTPQALFFESADGVRIPFVPGDFTQVNAALNPELVARALALVPEFSGQKIFDGFCGLGNFALPMARRGAEVLAVEGSAEMVARLQALGAVTTLRADLFAPKPHFFAALGQRDVWLIDPPRAGAKELLTACPPRQWPRQIVYVSCNPATLARDGKILMAQGYRPQTGFIADMFVQTAHLESAISFVR